MHRKPQRPFFLQATAVALALSGAVYGGPPYITDDPETVAVGHWEINLAIQQYHSAGGWSGAGPEMDANYGVAPDLQLHAMPSLSYSKAPGELTHIGYGDTELGFKYRFVHETDSFPQISIYPLVELPSGDRAEDLGNGKAQVFLPVWLQKKLGDWTTFGGGGYWFNPGPDNHDYWYAGWALERKLTDSFSPGLEVQFRSAQTVGGRPSTALNFGGTWDLSDTYHVLFSAGHTVQGQSQFQGYLALQITFGPKEEGQSKK